MASSAATARPTTAATRKRLRTSATSDETSESSRTAMTDHPSPTSSATITVSPSCLVTRPRPFWPSIPASSIAGVKSVVV